MKWFYDEGYNYGGGLPGEPREIHGFLCASRPRSASTS